MITAEKPPLNEDLLVHFGVKGMKWGVRKQRTSSESEKEPEKQPRFSEKTRRTATLVAVGVGALAVAVGAIYLSKKMRTWQENSPDAIIKGLGKEYADSFILKGGGTSKVLHMTSGGFQGGPRIVSTGGFPSPLKEYVSAFGNFERKIGVKKVSGGKLAATFLDPEGRVDRGGRSIIQQVLIPKSMASGIKTEQDVVSKIWPHVKDAYAEYFKKPYDAFGRAI